MDHHTAKRNHRCFSTASANVHDHIARGLRNGNFSADSGREWLLDEVGNLGTGRKGGIEDRPSLDLGDARGYTDHHFGLKKAVTAHDTVDKIGKHGLRYDVIGNHPVAHGAGGHDIARSPTQHLFGLVAHGNHTVILRSNGHHRGLVEDYAVSGEPNEGVCGT